MQTHHNLCKSHHNSETSTCDPLKYKMGNPIHVLIVSVKMEKSIRIQRVKGPVKKKKFNINLQIFSYPSVSTCVLGAQKNSLSETVLLSTHNICFG